MKQSDNEPNITSLAAGFFSSKEKELKMTIEKEKAPQPWTVTELSKTQTLNCNSLIKLGKSILWHTQSTCSALLSSDLHNAIALIIMITGCLAVIYSIGGV